MAHQVCTCGLWPAALAMHKASDSGSCGAAPLMKGFIARTGIPFARRAAAKQAVTAVFPISVSVPVMNRRIKWFLLLTDDGVCHENEPGGDSKGSFLKQGSPKVP